MAAETPTKPNHTSTPAEREAARAADGAREAIATALRTVVRGEVDTSRRRRAEYSTDASNYRVVPEVVVFPRDADDVLGALDIARELSIPVTARGAGTSVAGNAVGPGVVFDFSRHMHRVESLNLAESTARVQPGVVMSALQREAAKHGLRFGPDPSTQNRATLGGMIGNNACGPHAVAYGRTADNVVELDVVDGTGRRFTAGAGDPTFAVVPGLAEFVRENLGLIRTTFGRFGRQVSGYSLEHLLPENGSDLAKALVGTEGTCVTVLEAVVGLVPVPSKPTLVVLGYDDMPTAADDVPALLALKPLAVEGLDARLVDVVRRAKGEAAVPGLPPGAGWLMVEVGGADAEEALAGAREIVAASASTQTLILPAGPEATQMWQIRADGAGLAGRTPAGAQAWPGWEDSAVPPERLGAYLRELDSLMSRFGVDGLPYGHFGDGCVHLRIDLPLASGTAQFRAFLLEAAELVAAHGGSLSGEHGDGRARSELLPIMYPPEAIDLLARFKALFDPDDLLNPGVVVRPRAVDDDLRRPAARPVPAKDVKPRRGRQTVGFAFGHDGGDLTTAVHRCVGVGKCRADNHAAGGFMCPSYQATKDEKDVTRGRARVLQEATNGRLIGGLSAPEVRESLDLCLACKACSSDCPAGVDMAQYKSEALHRTYRGRLRPRDHYALGWLPRWARLAGIAPKLVNALLGWGPLGRLVLRLGGMDTRRSIPHFADVPFRVWWKRDGGALAGAAGGGPAGGGSAGSDPEVLGLPSADLVPRPVPASPATPFASSGSDPAPGSDAPPTPAPLGGGDTPATPVASSAPDPAPFQTEDPGETAAGSAMPVASFGSDPAPLVGGGATVESLAASGSVHVSPGDRGEVGAVLADDDGEVPSVGGGDVAASVAPSSDPSRSDARPAPSRAPDDVGPEPDANATPRRPRVLLWTDSFSDTMAPSVPQAAVRVLVAAGYDVVVPDDQACCGLTWISTGQLDGARKRLGKLLEVLGPVAVNGIPIVGLEPSCTAVLRSDLLDLFPDDPRAHAVAAATRTLAELLTDPATAPGPESGWTMPDLTDVTAVVQPHCHQHSVLGFDADAALLRGAGARLKVLAGCCGLAGNFGMQKGHYEVSVAVAENELLPALRDAGDGDVFLADGFSCRTQAQDLVGVRGKALAELLADRL